MLLASIAGASWVQLGRGDMARNGAMLISTARARCNIASSDERPPEDDYLADLDREVGEPAPTPESSC